MMSKIVKVAAAQFSCCKDMNTNIAKAEEVVRSAASRGANIILLQELFQTLYFCQDQIPQNFQLAYPIDEHPVMKKMINLAKELNVVLPISLFERANYSYFNTVVVIDADGEIIGKYRKSHIPDGPGYQEKYYFNPGDTGFKVFDTKYCKIGVGICWDQWFPECARALTLMGADVIFYPTAIGSEPQDKTINSKSHWTRTMQGHSAANCIPVVCSNRIGEEKAEVTPNSEIKFYGSSFITDNFGEIVQIADENTESILLSEFDVIKNRNVRASWGVLRDRRPELYGTLLTLDGEHRNTHY